MKKKLFICIAAALLLLCTLPVAACTDSGKTTVTPIRTVGTFSGCRVDLVRMETEGEAVPDVVVEYTVGDVYIATLGNPSYKYLAYTSEEDYLLLPQAYEQGLIGLDDLYAIAEAEEPYDTLLSDTLLSDDAGG